MECGTCGVVDSVRGEVGPVCVRMPNLEGLESVLTRFNSDVFLQPMEAMSEQVLDALDLGTAAVVLDRKAISKTILDSNSISLGRIIVRVLWSERDSLPSIYASVKPRALLIDFQLDKVDLDQALAFINSLPEEVSIYVSGRFDKASDVLPLLTSRSSVLVDTSSFESFSPGELVTVRMRSDRPDGLVPTVVVDESGVALGLVYSSAESVIASVEKKRGIYFSRSRGLWEKGLTSGAWQDLLRIELDCDSDALKFTVRQHGAGFCHLERRNCWSQGHGITQLFSTLESRKAHSVAKSYTNRLFEDPKLLNSKILEEAHELVDASDRAHVVKEAADVIYFASVLCAREGIRFSEIERELDLRSLRIRRRKGDAKPPMKSD